MHLQKQGASITTEERKQQTNLLNRNQCPTKWIVRLNHYTMVRCPQFGQGFGHMPASFFPTPSLQWYVILPLLGLNHQPWTQVLNHFILSGFYVGFFHFQIARYNNPFTQVNNWIPFSVYFFGWICRVSFWRAVAFCIWFFHLFSLQEMKKLIQPISRGKWTKQIRETLSDKARTQILSV